MSGRPRVVVVLLLAIALGGSVAPTAAPQPDPTPDPNFAITLLPRPCAFEGNDPYERRFYKIEGWKGPDYERYPGACQRLRFAYGPIAVKPGQNDVLIGPVTTEKPNQDGFITRFEPNLVRADGKIPPVEQVHLHHGTWLAQPEYGSGPFFAAGEEKTIAPFPRGYGLPIKATDQWQLLHMVHSAVQNPMEVYITYDIDFVPKAKGEELGLKPAYPVWLDVRPSGYPVFNTQRSFGGADGKCTWPKEQCASFDPWGKHFTGQGQPGNGRGEDFKLPGRGEELGRIESFEGGTLIGIGGHVHPGGLANEIDLVRPGRRASPPRRRAKRRRSAAGRRATASARRRQARRCRAGAHRKAGASARRRGARRCLRRLKLKPPARGDSVRIYTGKPVYWSHKDPSKPGGPPTSWDMSMRVTGLPYWGVRVKPGDILRSNATYETRIQSSYENMGIAVTLLVPHKDGKPQARGIDPFRARRDTGDRCRSGGLRGRRRTLCDKGVPTHGHYKENGNHSGPEGSWNAPRPGLPTSDVGIVDFLYEPGDFSTLSMTGLPAVKLGTKLRFTNADSHSIYHTVTSCGFPCQGRTSASFPLADGKTSAGRKLDFDSSELGFGAPAIGPAKQEASWDLPVTEQEGFKPGEVVTYFCRIHPSMRGAFEVQR
jgi:plastocyanin